MDVLLEKINRSIDEISDQNLTMDMTEQQIIDLIYQEELFVKTISIACPTSFLACC